MNDAIKILPHYTYSEYEKWEGKWEVIDGVPYAMSPLPVPKHQIIAGNLHVEFSLQLKKCSACKAYQPIDYLVQEDTILQPDMLIVCGEILKKYLDFPPVLVAEVLSPSTAAKDRFYKFNIYQAQNIRYYLIIDPDLEEIEVYELYDKKYKMTASGRDISYNFVLDSCTANIDFNEIWK
jgi:Uma2 family endonuclease